ncbi:BofC C-terminal domain-containing protein [Clostridiaceae bacterium M8S5]|nr:BofC C-terminal domain-containing protein [Clostridiaceae bacterium M8S5]
MKNYKKVFVFVFYMVFIIVGFAYGYHKGKDISKDNLQAKKQLTEQINQESAVIKQEDKITPNTKLEYVYNYTKCNHTLKEIQNPTSNIIGMNKEEYMLYLTKNNPQWELIDFSSDRITMSIDKKQLCPEHFIIGVENGLIAIHKVDEDGNKVLYKIINNSIKLLNEIDQQKLIEGIVVNNEEEMIEVLENFSS